MSRRGLGGLKAAWSNTAEGARKYHETRAEAQARANETGFDFGIERNDLFKTFRTFMLPRRENRYGHEQACEVVSAEDLSRCQPGHGPLVPAKLSRTAGEI